jgi:hypothetical protein
VKRFGIIVSLVVFAIVLSVVLITNIQAAPNYADGIQKAIAWFDANRCGTDVATNNVFSSWRGACHTSDAVNGGFHDAGDHVKFQLPAAFAASAIGWSIYEFRSTWPASALTKAEQELKIFCDYSLAAWNGSTLVVQIGDGGADHGYWGSPENQTGSRPSYRNAAADILGQTAASLALMYINFGGTNYLNAAKAMYNVAKANPASQSTVADGFYTSGSSYDDMVWAAIWLYYATNDSSYLTNCNAWFEMKNDPGDPPYQKPWTYCWDDASLGNTIMLYKLTGDVKYYNALIWNFDYFTKTLRKTTYGLPWLDSWACLRYASAEAGLMYIAYKNFGINYNTSANMMIDYCFGTNPKSLSYLTNTTYATNTVKHPHHRANEPVRGGPTNGMVGALAGGPDQSDNFTDDVNQYTFTEVALDYNASFLLGCVGRKYVADGGTGGKTPSPAPTPTPAPTSAPGTGTGLLGTYYSGTALSGTPLLTRVDSKIDFNWAGGSFTTGGPSDSFSVRWTGQIEARSTETYTFYLNHDDGARMWVNNVQIINNWTDHAAIEDTGTINLVMGTKYPITVEFYESSGDATCNLYWSTPTVITKQIVPVTQLYNSSTTPLPVTPTPTIGRTPTPPPPVTPTPTIGRTPTPTTGRTPTPPPPVTPTPTIGRTPTPPPATPTPVPQTGSIKVQFYNQNTAVNSNQIYLNMKIVNTGSSAIALSNVKVRYYYTIDGTQPQNFWCDWSPAGSSNVTGTFVTISPAKTGADTYVEIGFTSGAGSLAANGGNTTVQARVAKNNWTNYNQANDYSFNSSATTFVDWTQVTGYVSGTLQWGIEP